MIRKILTAVITAVIAGAIGAFIRRMFTPKGRHRPA